MLYYAFQSDCETKENADRIKNSIPPNKTIDELIFIWKHLQLYKQDINTMQKSSTTNPSLSELIMNPELLQSWIEQLIEQKLNSPASNQVSRLDLFERYKDAIVLLETMLSDIRKEQMSFFGERIKHVSANLEETGIDRVIVDGWFKTLVDNMFNSYEISTSLLNDTLMSIKDEFNQKQKK